MFVEWNPNPRRANVGDCAVRAVAKATGRDWEEAYAGLTVQGYLLADLPSANHVWGAFLRRHGYRRDILPNTCPDCYTLADFCADHPRGCFVVALSGHVVTVVDGDWYDTWDSGGEVPLYYWFKEGD